MTATIPVNADELAEVFSDAGRVQKLINAGEFKDYVTAYARATLKNDTDLGNQIKDEVQKGLVSFMKDNGQVDNPLTRGAAIQASTASRKGTVFNAKADGMKIESEFSGAADYFQTIWHNTERTPDVMAKLGRVRNAFSSNDGSSGGFLVPETLRSELLKLSLEDSVIRSRATVIPMSSPRVGIPSVDATSNVSSVFGGIVGYWTEEAGQITTSNAKFAVTELDAHKLTAYTTVPNELLADGVAFEAFLSTAFPAALSFYEDDSFINGNGVGQPQGFQNASAAVVVAKESGQLAATILWENIVKMYSRMLPASLNRAVWLVSPACFAELATMALSVGTGGSAIWLNNGQVGPPMSILGRPVIVTEKQPNLGTQGDVAFVDLAYYLVGDRQQMTATSSPHFLFQTDQTAFKVIERVDGKVWLNSAITPRNNGSTLSPVILLASR